MKGVKYVYHGSGKVLSGKKLIPKKAKDLNNNPDNSLVVIYASDIKEEAIVMGLLSCKGVGGSMCGVHNGKVVSAIYEGWPEQDYFYLYTLPFENFEEKPKGSHQYVSMTPVKPEKIERLLVKDYIHLTRKATKEELEKWLKKHGLAKITPKRATEEEFKFMNNERVRQYGKGVNLLNKKHHKKSNFFFAKNKNKIVAFGFLRPINVTYMDKKYDIFALGGIMAVKGEKKKGYGTILIKNMIEYSKKTGKTILGFCGSDNAKFYKKAGLKIVKDFSLRLEMENPKTKERTPDADGACPGIYFEGNDKLISYMMKTKGIATYWMPDITEPHF